MALEDVLRSLAEHWDDVLARLGPAEQAELVDLVATIGLGGDDALDAASDVTRLLLRSLPGDHLVRVAIRSGIRLSTGAGPVLPAELRTRLGRLPGVVAGQPDGPQPTEPEDVWTAVRRRLLLTPSLSPAGLRTAGQDPQQPALIRLEGADGTVRIPRFQFGVDGAALPLVLRINQVLDVAGDPWGVADWWLGENAWLQAPPAGLIGVVDDALLLATAAATAED